MFYTIYKITNKIDNKIYIGKHQTENLDDGYMGSGKHLKRAQKKHGIQNFVKEILFTFDSEDQMNAKEKELVTEEFCKRKDTYNLCPGGHGGFGFINEAGLNWTPEKNKRMSALRQTKMTAEQKSAIGRLGAEGRQKAIIAGTCSAATYGMLGKKQSIEARRKIGEFNSSNQRGSKNSQFGIRFKWMNDGIKNKKVSYDDIDSYLKIKFKFGKIGVGNPRGSGASWKGDGT